MKSRLPNGSGYKVEFYEAVSDKLEDIAQKDSDWEMSLFWDATGNQKYCWFSKEGFLEGFDCNPQSFDTEMMLAHKVNCWMVTSLETDIKIKYPVPYYHCTTLDSADIRRQWFEVTAGLDSVGIRVVVNVYDCAGEHVRFFQNVLKQRDDCLVRRDHTWVVPDSPHVNKNCRNVMISSGSGPGHTRWLCRNGNYIGWCVVQGGYTVSTTFPDGTPRPLVQLVGFPYDVVTPKRDTQVEGSSVSCDLQIRNSYLF